MKNLNKNLLKVLALVMLVTLIGCSKAEEKAESIAEKAGSAIKEKAAAVQEAMPNVEEAQKSMSEAASGVTEQAVEMKDELIEQGKEIITEKIGEVLPEQTGVTAESVQKSVEDASMQKAEEAATDAMKENLPGGLKVPSYK